MLAGVAVFGVPNVELRVVGNERYEWSAVANGYNELQFCVYSNERHLY